MRTYRITKGCAEEILRIAFSFNLNTPHGRNLLNLMVAMVVEGEKQHTYSYIKVTGKMMKETYGISGAIHERLKLLSETDFIKNVGEKGKPTYSIGHHIEILQEYYDKSCRCEKVYIKGECFFKDKDVLYNLIKGVGSQNALRILNEVKTIRMEVFEDDAVENVIDSVVAYEEWKSNPENVKKYKEKKGFI